MLSVELHFFLFNSYLQRPTLDKATAAPRKPAYLKWFTACDWGKKKNQVGAAKSGWQIYKVSIKFTVHILGTEEINLGNLNLIVHTKEHIKICIADVKKLGLYKSSG